MSFHYNPTTHAAYYVEQPGVLLKVTAEGVTKIKNGEDGVLFTLSRAVRASGVQPSANEDGT